jgi:hypothetical protein
MGQEKQRELDVILVGTPERAAAHFRDDPVDVFLEDKNSRLKKIVADLTLDREMLQDVIRRKL